MTTPTPASLPADPRVKRRRWALLNPIDIGAEGDPYLDRMEIVKTPFGSIYLHHIHREDRERDPHDHPWWFISLVIAGSYEEAHAPDKRNTMRVKIRTRRRWSVAITRRRSAHIITEVTGPLWTLVITGPRRGSWRFWNSGQFTPWQEYDYTEPARSGAWRNPRGQS